jgi:imidazolonepropionase-like amidohydrolase
MTERTLIANGTVIDATGAPARPRHSVLVEGNLIVQVGDQEKTRALAQAGGSYKTIDATGMTVMPGLIDTHCHISYGNSTTTEETHIYTPVEYRTLRAANDARKVLRAGVTSICDPGSTWNIAVGIRDAINSGLIEGPRMVAAGQYISTYNSIGSQFPVWIEHPVSANSVLCNTQDEMVKETRRQIKQRVDLIKVAGDGDHIRGDGFEEGSITLDELKAISNIAHLAGKRCVIHSRSGRVAANAAQAGFDWVIHASFLSEDDLRVLLECRTPINPTLALLVNMVEWGPEMGAAPAMIDGFKSELETASRNLTKAYKAGAMILAGTDSGQSSVPYGEWHARELECLIEYLGMSAMDAIVAGTRNGAFAMGMPDKLGTLQPNRLADLIVVDGDPLADITVLQQKQRLKVVMKDGKVVDTVTPLPQPRQYRWEKAQYYWSDRRVATQDVVRETARVKPRWMS